MEVQPLAPQAVVVRPRPAPELEHGRAVVPAVAAPLAEEDPEVQGPQEDEIRVDERDGDVLVAVGVVLAERVAVVREPVVHAPRLTVLFLCRLRRLADTVLFPDLASVVAYGRLDDYGDADGADDYGVLALAMPLDVEAADGAAALARPLAA